MDCGKAKSLILGIITQQNYIVNLLWFA